MKFSYLVGLAAILGMAVAVIVSDEDSSGNRESFYRPTKSDRKLGPRPRPPLSSEARVVLREMNEAWNNVRAGRHLTGETKGFGPELLDEFIEAGATADDLLDWGVEVIEGGGDTMGIIAEMVLKAAELDGRAAVEWLVDNRSMENFDQTRVGNNWNYYFRTASEFWMQTDPQAAIQMVEANFESLRSEDVRYIIDDWDPADRAGAMAWIEGQIAAGNERLSPTWAGAIVYPMAQEDPGAATAWMESLPERMHWWGSMTIAQGSPADSLPEVQAWISSQSPDDRTFDAGRSALAERLVDSDPIAAMNLAIDITSTRRREPIIVEAGRALYQVEPDTLLEWLPTSGLTEDLQRAILPSEE